MQINNVLYTSLARIAAAAAATVRACQIVQFTSQIKIANRSFAGVDRYSLLCLVLATAVHCGSAFGCCISLWLKVSTF